MWIFLNKENTLFGFSHFSMAKIVTPHDSVPTIRAGFPTALAFLPCDGEHWKVWGRFHHRPPKKPAVQKCPNMSTCVKITLLPLTLWKFDEIWIHPKCLFNSQLWHVKAMDLSARSVLFLSLSHRPWQPAPRSKGLQDPRGWSRQSDLKYLHHDVGPRKREQVEANLPENISLLSFFQKGKTY